MDVVVEGDALPVTDETILQRVAELYAAKYGEPFIFTVGEGAFQSDGATALVFQVRPTKAFGFGKGDAFSQTRWRF